MPAAPTCRAPARASGSAEAAQLDAAPEVLRGRRLRLRGEPIRVRRVRRPARPAPPRRGHDRVRGRRDEQLLVEPPLDVPRPGRPRRLPGGPFLHGQHRRVPVRGGRARAARERGRRGGAARSGDLDRLGDSAELHREQDVELPHRAVTGLAALALALLACVVLPSAAVAAELERPPSETEPPRFFERSANEVERIASRADKVREARRDGPLRPTAYTKGTGRWQVSFFRDKDEVVQVQVDDRSGAILEQWSGDQVAWTMARGYAGAFGRKLNAPYVWLPLCVLFLVPFVDLRRPFRLLHLDLLVLLAFGLSHVFFNRGEIGVSAPLVYPGLLYLLGRVLFAAFRPRRAAGPLVPHLPLVALVAGLVFLTAFRVALNVADSNVIDVGYAGVIGADRIVDGDHLYGEGFSRDVERGDTYGPVTY